MNGARAPGVGDPSGGHHRNPLYRVNDQRDDGEGPKGGTRQRAAFVKAGGDNNIRSGLLRAAAVLRRRVDVTIDNGDPGSFQFVEQRRF